MNYTKLRTWLNFSNRPVNVPSPLIFRSGKWLKKGSAKKASFSTQRSTFTNVLIGFLLPILFFSCSKKIYTDRSQFIKDGEVPPTVDLSNYRSVQERPGQDSSLAVAIAISGGGSRAACFGFGVLLGLEELELNNGQTALTQIDYLSTVSGGGFAGGAYIAALYEHDRFQKGRTFSLENYLDKHIRDDLRHSYAGTLLRSYLNPRIWFSLIDDGDALEKAIDDHILGYKHRRKVSGSKKEARSIRLGDLFIDRDSSAGLVKYPMLFANSSVLSTMAIFPFSPDILSCHMVNGYTHQLKIVKEDYLNPYRVPLSVGIKASGSFPVLISNTTLGSQYHEKRRHLHLIDGAMSDNVGYYTALEVLKQDRSKRKALLVVDADAGGNRYTFSKRGAAYGGLRVFGRLPSSGLEARRVFLEKDIIDICEKANYYPIFFSFNQFIRNNEAPLPGDLHPQKEQKRLIQVLQSGIEPTDIDKQILYEVLTNIGTKYTITDEEQELLFLAGKFLVYMQKEEINRALQPEEVEFRPAGF